MPNMNANLSQAKASLRRAENRVAVETLRRQIQNVQQRGIDLSETAAGYTTSTCVIKVNDTGVAIAPFMFACKYAQQPTITYGFQLQSAPSKGRIPQFSATVNQWYSQDRLPNSRLYTGAELYIVTENVDGVSFIVTAVAHGIAFSGPTDLR